jgi:hypothetical protein
MCFLRDLTATVMLRIGGDGLRFSLFVLGIELFLVHFADNPEFGLK